MPTTVEALAKFCADTLHSGVKYVNGQKPVTCLAEVSGGGGSYLQEAIDLGADCLVTGEAAHHIALLAKEKGIGLVVAATGAPSTPSPTCWPPTLPSSSPS